MIPTLTPVDVGHVKIFLSYLDEGVALPDPAETIVAGDESAAVGYVAVFDADIRRIYMEYFPQPVMPEIEMESE